MITSAPSKLRLEHLISERELCHRTGWNRTTIWRFRNRKRDGLPHYRLPNGRVMFDPRQIDIWIERFSVGIRGKKAQT